MSKPLASAFTVLAETSPMGTLSTTGLTIDEHDDGSLSAAIFVYVKGEDTEFIDVPLTDSFAEKLLRGMAMSN